MLPARFARLRQKIAVPACQQEFPGSRRRAVAPRPRKNSLLQTAVTVFIHILDLPQKIAKA